MSSFKTVLFLILIGCSVFSCHQRKNTADNYFHNGFITDRIFQCIIIVEPDKNEQGLVARRENALNKARLELKQKAAEALADYCFNTVPEFKKTHNKDEIKKSNESLLIKLMPIASKGNLVMQYYNDDESVVAVYRIKSSNLRDRINDVAKNILQTQKNI